MAAIDRSVVEHLSLFSDLGGADIDALLGEARAVRFAKGAHVFEQGGEAHAFYVLLHGHLQAVKTTPDGQQIVMRYVSPGEVFGVAMAIGVSAYPATAIAVVESVALAWPLAAWPRIAARYPSLVASTLQTIGQRLQDAQTRIIEASTQEVERRVAHERCPGGAAGRTQDRTRHRNRFSDQPAGYRGNDRHHAAHRQPHPQRAGREARPGGERPPADRHSRCASALRRGRAAARSLAEAPSSPNAAACSAVNKRSQETPCSRQASSTLWNIPSDSQRNSS